MEKIDTQVMKVDTVVGLFQTMVIMSLNMGKLDSGGKYFEK
jgi:hypothetical protein